MNPRPNLILASALVLGAVLAAGLAYGYGHRSASLAPASIAGAPAGLAGSGPGAPEFAGITAWDNSPPLTIAGLRGKVVLIDFWTYSCINCQRTFPFLQGWWHRYRDAGLVIVGVHSPEFDFEKSNANIRAAIRTYGVEWPVAVDSEMATWNAYGNQYWPAEYLIDRTGRIRHTHFGEGEYDQTELAIRALLRERGATVPGGLVTADPGVSSAAQGETGEIYLGQDRGALGNPGGYRPGTAGYTDPGGRHENNQVYLQGSWNVGRQYAQHGSNSPPGADYALIDYRATRVFMVASSASGTARAWLTLDGRDLASSEAGSEVRFQDGHAYVDVDHADLYHLVVMPKFGQHTLRVSPDSPALQLFTFTFGS